MKILIADDHKLFNDGIKSLITNELDIEIIGQVYDGNAVTAFVKKQVPDLILLDINMPLMNGIEVAEILLKNYQNLKIIALTMYAEPKYIKEFQRIGVQGYLLKNASKDELLKTIQAVFLGKKMYDNKLIVNNLHSEDSFVKLYNLTKREVEVINLLKEGMTSQAIADKLFLSVFTVDTHRKNILFKLNLKNTADLINFAMENGI